MSFSVGMAKGSPEATNPHGPRPPVLSLSRHILREVESKNQGHKQRLRTKIFTTTILTIVKN